MHNALLVALKQRERRDSFVEIDLIDVPGRVRDQDRVTREIGRSVDDREEEMRDIGRCPFAVAARDRSGTGEVPCYRHHRWPHWPEDPAKFAPEGGDYADRDLGCRRAEESPA